MRGLLGALFFLGVIIYGAYTGFLAFQAYLEISNLVEEVVQRELPKVSGPSWPAADRAARLRESIVNTGKQSGLALDADAVSISEESGALTIHVTYPYPVVKYGTDKAVTVPISTSHTFNVPGAG